MAKPRKKTAARSSMSRYLQAGTAAAALEVVEEIEELPKEILPATPKESLKEVSKKAKTEPVGQGTANRVVRSVPAVRQPEPSTPVYSEVELEQASISRKREIGFSNRTNNILDKLVDTYSEATGSTVTVSHVIRAMLLASEDALPEILDEISSLGPMKRPGNEKKFDVEREEYERTLGAAILDGLRKE